MLIKFNFFDFKYDYYNNSLQEHRMGAPSYEYDGSKFWCKNGKWHREDGPAKEYFYGDKCYYLNNKEYSEKEYWGIIRFGVFV